MSWTRWTGGRYQPAVLAWLALCAALWLARPGRRPIRAVRALVVAGLLAGAVVSCLQGEAWLRQCALVADSGAREWTAIVEADPMPGAFGTTVRARIAGGVLDGARVRVRWPQGSPVPELGRTVRFSAILNPLPTDESWARRAARSGACGTGSAWRAEVGAWRPGVSGALLAWRASMLDRMADVPGVGGDLLEGIVLGDRRRLIGTRAEEEFRVLGLSHLVAVSGSHLALACGAVALIGSALGLRRRPLVLATFAAGAAYAVVTGMPYSALRSLLMLGVAGSAQLLGRRADGLAALAVAVAAVLVIEPWSVFDVGLQLSALAVAGLLVFGSLATRWTTAGLPPYAYPVGATLALTGVAQAVTVPVVASTFGMVSVAAPLANAYAGPLVSLALWFGLLGTVVSSVMPAIGRVAVQASAAVLGATAWLSHLVAELPGAASAMNAGPALGAAVAAAGAAVWIWWPLPRSVRSARRTIAVLVTLTLAFAVGPAPVRSARLVVLDVGQGDAILVQDGGRTMLVDTGPDGTTLRRALARHGIRRIDVLVLTHAHDDHTGGVTGLSGTASIGWIGVPGVGPPCVAEGAPWLGPDVEVRTLSAGDSWRMGQMQVRGVWPPAEPMTELGTNDTSVVLQVGRGEFDAVLTGDVEAEAQEGMASAGLLGDVEVLKVPHHGSVNGLTVTGLEGWDPEDALVSVGVGNSFGHPDPVVMRMLESAGAQVWRTDLRGDVEVEIRRHGYSVRSERRGEPVAVRARMSPTARCHAAPARPPRACVAEAPCGSQGHPGARTRLPDLRRRGSAARARDPPASRSCGRGGRSRLQLRQFRWRDRRCGRRDCGCQHAAVRIRTSSRGGAGGGQHARCGPGAAG
ncbi:MAG: DNA internalization-related competence protein ComEC/Rec2 [Coriobacteriia bacterium]|nr:DNA internalization-related competence protein ComEC/Rec2 [Coriobacteriia bacterium]